MSTKAELACVYASLILVDDDVAVTVCKLIWCDIFYQILIELIILLRIMHF